MIRCANTNESTANELQFTKYYKWPNGIGPCEIPENLCYEARAEIKGFRFVFTAFYSDEDIPCLSVYYRKVDSKDHIWTGYEKELKYLEDYERDIKNIIEGLQYQIYRGWFHGEASIIVVLDRFRLEGVWERDIDDEDEDGWMRFL